MEVIVFPDAEGVAVSWLAADLATYGSDAPVSSTVPNPRPPEFVTVHRSGGPRRDLITDAASLTFECWSDKPSGAAELAQLVRGIVASWQGRYADGVTAYRVQEFAGPQMLPDPASKQSRYTFTATVELRGGSIPSGGIS